MWNGVQWRELIFQKLHSTLAPMMDSIFSTIFFLWLLHTNIGNHSQIIENHGWRPNITAECGRNHEKWQPIFLNTIWFDKVIETESGKAIEKHRDPHIDGILPKGPYPPCLCMADRALLAGYPPIMIFHFSVSTVPGTRTSADTVMTNLLSHTFISFYWNWLNFDRIRL